MINTNESSVIMEERIGGEFDCMAGLADIYQDYIDDRKEIKDINMEFSAHYQSGME